MQRGQVMQLAMDIGARDALADAEGFLAAVRGVMRPNPLEYTPIGNECGKCGAVALTSASQRYGACVMEDDCAERANAAGHAPTGFWAIAAADVDGDELAELDGFRPPLPYTRAQWEDADAMAAEYGRLEPEPY